MRLFCLSILVFCCSSSLVENQSTNWKQIKFERTKNLKKLQTKKNGPGITRDRLHYFGPMKTNQGHFNRTLDKILKVRVPDTPSHREVREFIIEEMTGLGWKVEEDPFEENTVIGNIKFTNIIATLNPGAPRRMVLACHYDSKITPEGFLGATDSAVPCAQIINLAHTMKLDLDEMNDQGLTLQLLFLDGEEAFVQWTSTDSIYGARHLASKLEQSQYEHSDVKGNELDRIDIFVLLDLLGTKNPKIISSQTSTDPWFRKLIEIENGLHKIGAIQGANIFSTMSARNLGIEDDHIPFLRRGVPILHLIPVPFPEVWHNLGDDGNAIDFVTVEKLNRILRVFVSEYLEIS